MHAFVHRNCRLSLCAACALLACLVLLDHAAAQLRIVNYNTAQGARSGIDIVLKSIGEELRNGIAKPIDILALQEQTSFTTTTQDIVNGLNGLYGAGTYALVPLNGGTTGAGRPGLIYNTQTVQVLAQSAFGTTNSTNQPRQTLRYRLRPVGYDSAADFYLYNAHFKAGQGFDSGASVSNEDRRLVEATAIRNNSNALGQGTHIIYTGDFNLVTAGEPAFQKLLEAGNGQAFDPLGLTQFDDNPGTTLNGEWRNNNSPAVRAAHTQSPCSSGGCVGTTGGLDDRFDFQLSTSEFNDGEGLSLISGSYHAFGNNGSLACCNANINSASNTVTFPGVTSHSKSQILDALWSVTDHLPVVADYQLPAILSAVVNNLPTTLNVGEIFNLQLTVSNAASVVAPNGADELDYSVTTAFGGAVSGSFFNQVDLALGGGNLHLLTLDTSTPGEKTGTIFVQSGSQGVQNAAIQLPISYQVLATTLAGDFNQDGTVDAADYSVWRDGLGSLFDGDDFLDWKNHFGQSLGSGSASRGSGHFEAVPEPAAAVLLLSGVCLLARRSTTLRAWNRAR